MKKLKYKCPECGSPHDIYPENDIEEEGNTCFQQVICSACGTRWLNEYALIEMYNIRRGKKKQGNISAALSDDNN